MNRRAAGIIFLCFLLLITGAASALAGSFDLLLKGHRAYAELAVLADAGLLKDYSSAQELAEVYPLTRYEAALLIGDLLIPTGQKGVSSGVSADALMWKMLAKRRADPTVTLSSEIVAQTRTASEAAFRSLGRLAEELADELDALGIAASNVDKGFFSLAVVDGTMGSQLSQNRAAMVLAQLGVVKICGRLTAGFRGKNGFSLSSGLIVEVSTLGVTPLAALSDAVGSFQANGAANVRSAIPEAAALPLGETIGSGAVGSDTYSPVEVSVLFEKLGSEQQELPAADPEALELQAPAEPDEGSLRLAANMTDGRPAGLLTSYFLNRTDPRP